MFNLVSIITTGGYLAVTGIVFAESGLFVGFFLPGDSLLFTAGFLASQGYLNIVLLVVLSFIAAVAGDSVGYAIGKRLGPKIFVKDDSLFFNKDHIMRAHAFYEKHGGRAITIARFMPVVRTFAPVIAGVGGMRYRSFLFYNVLGAALWAIGIPLLGYFAGAFIPNVDHYMLPIIMGIILISFAPSIIHLLRHSSDRARLISAIRGIFSKKPNV